MQCFTADRLGENAPRSGIWLRGDPPAVEVGERGRGRWLDVVGVQAGMPAPLLEASVVWRPNRGAAIVAADGPTDRALVLLPDASGFRGGCSWCARSMCSPYVGPLPGGDPHDGGEGRRAWQRSHAAARLPVVSGHAEWQTFRRQARPASVGGLTPVAAGYCAQGAAGRAGGGPAFLVIVEPGEGLMLVRAGRLYDRPPVTCWNWTGTAWQHYDPAGPAGEAITL